MALNMVPVPLENYNIGVTESGRYKILMNTDDMKYGGSGYPDGTDSRGTFKTVEEGWNGKPCHISVNLPPLGGIYFQKVKTTSAKTAKDKPASKTSKSVKSSAKNSKAPAKTTKSATSKSAKTKTTAAKSAKSTKTTKKQ